MMRKPAELAGLGALQSFLERGYAAFRVMRGGSDFVDIVAGRERAISQAVFAGNDAVLETDGLSRDIPHERHLISRFAGAGNDWPSIRLCAAGTVWRNRLMSLGTIILIILVLALLGLLPTWPYSSGWGYGPSGGVGLIVVILIILVLMGRI